MTIDFTGNGIASTLTLGKPRVAPTSNLFGGAAATSVVDTAAKVTSSAPVPVANSKSTISVG